jgi:thymidylate synthase ThyX
VKVFIPDISNPETIAMLQALYSRSDTSVEEHLKGLTDIEIVSNSSEKKLQEKMKKFYIGYGHDSIGDCGSTTVFIEGVSIMAAKAIQNTPLYSGQESSTRYLNFSTQRDKVQYLLESTYSELYHKFSDRINDAIVASFLIYENVTRNLCHHKAATLGWDYSSPDMNPVTRRSVNAWAFDISRGFLPAGTTTQLSFHGSLRELRAHFKDLKAHTLPEVRYIAQIVLRKLIEKYPSSFKDSDLDFVMEDCQINSREESYPALRIPVAQTYSIWDKGTLWDSCSSEVVNYNGGESRGSSKKYGVIGFQSSKLAQLDYGSWRDLQRHRNGLCEATFPYWQRNDAGLIDGDNPLLIHDWYLKNIDQRLGLRSEVYAFHRTLSQLFSDLLHCAGSGTKYEEMTSLIGYLLPLGRVVPTSIFYSLEQWDYVFDLRLRDTVHPTLVDFLSTAVYEIGSRVPYFIKKYDGRIAFIKKERDSINYQRGKQTILLDDGSAISD